MILLLGGTSETAPLAQDLAQRGYQVLVSMATNEPLAIGDHPHIRRRCGRLDDAGMADLCRSQGIRAIVDVTHPYAAAARATARRVGDLLRLPYLTLVRPRTPMPGRDVHMVANHEDAAAKAVSFRRPILLTTGANNLLCYVCAAHSAGLSLVVRVLPRRESLDACRQAGIPAGHIIAEKGPFTVEGNRAHIRCFQIGTLVTKDSGQAGGVPSKLEAARLERCQVVMVERPLVNAVGAPACVQELLAKIVSSVPLEQ